MLVVTQQRAQSSFNNYPLTVSVKKHVKLDITFLKSCPIFLIQNSVNTKPIKFGTFKETALHYIYMIFGEML